MAPSRTSLLLQMPSNRRHTLQQALTALPGRRQLGNLCYYPFLCLFLSCLCHFFRRRAFPACTVCVSAPTCLARSHMSCFVAPQGLNPARRFIFPFLPFPLPLPQLKDLPPTWRRASAPLPDEARCARLLSRTQEPSSSRLDEIEAPAPSPAT